MNIQELFSSVISGCRSSLSRAITIVESQKNTKYQRELVRRAFQYQINNKNNNNSIRLAISGGPGAGKSTFIETFGQYLIEKFGHKVAVLAVDPSSAISGGSILADKTRMANLSRNQNAFIRPSPSKGHLGGVTRSTGQSILLCESAGYNIILIETVGVGQSEYAVADLSDVFALLVAPSGGDEIQAIKKGIVELADIIIITKSDGDLVKQARKISADFMSATKYINRPIKPQIKRCSSLKCEGIDDIWQSICKLVENQDEVYEKRRKQRVKLLRTYLMNTIMQNLEDKVNLSQYEEQLMNDDNLLIWDVVDQVLNKYDELR